MELKSERARKLPFSIKRTGLLRRKLLVFFRSSMRMLCVVFITIVDYGPEFFSETNHRNKVHPIGDIFAAH